MNIGKSVELCLKERGMKKSHLAKQLGYSNNTISSVVQSKTASGPMLESLVGFFEMKASEFIAVGEDYDLNTKSI